MPRLTSVLDFVVLLTFGHGQMSASVSSASASYIVRSPVPAGDEEMALGTCLTGDELMFLQQLPGVELFEIGELLRVDPTHHMAVTSSEWHSFVIESVRCSQHDDILLLREVLSELGYTCAAHRTPCSGRLDRLIGQLKSFGHRCSPADLMQAVQNGHRSRKDGPFQIGGCHVKWYNADEACRVLKDDVGDLQIVGDSLQRHLTQAILTVLSGDYETATSWMTEESDAAFGRCDCDAAYDDGHVVVNGIRNIYCRTKSIALMKNLSDVRIHLPRFCPTWQRMHLSFIFDNYNDPWYHMGADEDVILSPVAVQEAGTVLVGGGLHFRRMDERALDRVFNRIEFWNVSRRVCMTVHAPGSNKLDKYLARQGLAPTLAFNQLIRDKACQGGRDFVLESFAVTKDASSVDGTHYFQEPNILLAQLLLNALDARE